MTGCDNCGTGGWYADIDTNQCERCVAGRGPIPNRTACQDCLLGESSEDGAPCITCPVRVANPLGGGGEALLQIPATVLGVPHSLQSVGP